MPLDAFIDEDLWLFHRRPTPPEILAERIKVLRHAEAEGRFDQADAGCGPPRCPGTVADCSAPFIPGETVPGPAG